MAAKGKKAGSWMKPGMLVLAAMFSWSAEHEPEKFTPASIGGWLLGALTIALLARAGFALLTPLLRLAGALIGQALRQDRAES